MKALTTLFTMAPVLFALLAQAQHYCGFDPFLEHTHNHPSLIDERHTTNVRILEKMHQLTPESRANEYAIPVVVHIIHDEGAENIPDAQVEEAIEQLNDAFANEGDYFNPDGVNIPIRFCLAGTDPDGELTNGIVRVQDPLTDMNVPSEDLDLKDLSRWNPELYLNMWVVRSITRDPNSPGVVGYATFPTMHGSESDGLVMEAQFFGTTDGYSTVHVHEVGHYLGLFHTFQDGCPNDDCETSGDWVCDTPPDNHVFTQFCYDGTNSCATDDDDLSENNPFRPTELGGMGDQVDEQDNYMDYSNLICFNQFTPLQGDRMIAALLSERASLLEGDRCSTPCDDPFTVDFSAEALDAFVGEPLTFSAEGEGFSLTEWFIDGEFETSGNTVDLSFDNEGTFEVEGVASDSVPGCEQSVLFEITVTCEAVAFFETNGSQFPVNTETTYNYSGTGAASFSWSVNGAVESSSETLTFIYDEAGIYTVQLTVSNNFCSDTYTYYVAIGNCLTGREANYWSFNNVQGNFYALDFNQSGEDVLVEENPELPVPFGHNKGAFCDAAGNLRYISTGVKVCDPTGTPLQNGEDIMSHPSAHYGSIFVRKPGSDHEVYLFTCDAEENDFEGGLRYHLIDDNLNGGLGGVVEGEKNIFIDFVGIENAVVIRHCNLVDFWLVHYNTNEGVMKAHLFTEEGLTGDPVISDIPDLNVDNPAYSNPFVVNGPGNMIHRRNTTFSFDPATGTVETIHETNQEFAYTSAWSISSRYIYFWEGEFIPSIYRIDTHLPVDEWTDNIELIYEADITEFGLGINLTPTGKIYVESGFNGWVGEIPDPDAPSDEVSYNPNSIFTETFINGWQNNYHGYIYGPSLFVEGETEICTGGTHIYSVFRSDCITAPVDWSVDGDAALTNLSNGEIELTFESAGNVYLIAEAELACGSIVDTLMINVNGPLNLDLGEDQSLCAGDEIVLNAGDGFDSYSWQDGSSDSTFIASTPGTYTVTVTSGPCNATDSFTIDDVINPVIDLGPDFEVCNEPITLNAGDAFTDPVWQDGFSNQTYTVFDAGVYYVTATTPCFATDSVTVTDCGDIINSIDELSSEGMVLWPNPAKEEINVQAPTPIREVIVTDIRGREVMRKVNANRLQLRIPVNMLGSGVYTVEVVTEKARYRERLRVQP